MKKILLIGSLVFAGLANAQEYNKVAIDFGFGASKAFSRQGNANKINIPHVHLGARYNVSNLFGFKLGLDYTTFKNGQRKGPFSGKPSDAAIKKGAREFKTNYIGVTFNGVVNLGNTFNISQWTDKLTFLGNIGPGLALNSSKSYPKKGGSSQGTRTIRDGVITGNAGLSALYAVSAKLSVSISANAFMLMASHKTYDLNPLTNRSNTTFGASHGTLDLGLSYYIGSKEKHADFTPNQNGNPEELEALKAKIAKTEKDMMDDDKDGVPNYLDQEPGTAEGAKVDTKGVTVVVEKVVDMDGDGVLDVNDFCPTIKGVASANGCPDKDGDGVYDFIDKCPNAPGLAVDGGCPVVKATEKATMEKAMKGVQFDNGKATIIKKSTPILDEVAKVMIANPAYRLAINGHTDNVGDPAKNLQLSDDRAKAVKAYLMGKGIAESRLNAKGFGDSQPKADNKTTAGKAANRRVEFIISFEQ
jgi:outer membrane protein OmpA-like peptidoglycan-associated protein